MEIPSCPAPHPTDLLPADLTAAEASERLAQHGRNDLPAAKARGFGPVCWRCWPAWRAAELAARGLPARYWHVDVTREAAVKAAIDEVAAHLGSVDVLVNNAGVAGANKPTHEITEAEWDWVQAVNVKGVFFATKHAIPHLRRAGCGSIINADLPPYHASKGAVRLMSKTDAMIYAPERIRVNSVHPGFIWTPLVETHLKASGATDVDAARAETGRRHPLGHMGDVDDIAWGVVYLASEESKFVTGSELVIDGGYTAH